MTDQPIPEYTESAWLGSVPEPEPTGAVTLADVQQIREELNRLARRITAVPDDAPYNPPHLTQQQQFDGYARSINLANQRLAMLYPDDDRPISAQDLVTWVERAARELVSLREVAGIVGTMTEQLTELRETWDAYDVTVEGHS